MPRRLDMEARDPQKLFQRHPRTHLRPRKHPRLVFQYAGAFHIPLPVDQRGYVPIPGFVTWADSGSVLDEDRESFSPPVMDGGRERSTPTPSSCVDHTVRVTWPAVWIWGPGGLEFTYQHKKKSRVQKKIQTIPTRLSALAMPYASPIDS